jgi:hypothetical protein
MARGLALLVTLCVLAGPAAAVPPASSIKLKRADPGVLTAQQRSAGLIIGPPGVRLYGRPIDRGPRSAELYVGVPGPGGEQLFRLELVADWSASDLPIGCLSPAPTRESPALAGEGPVLSVTLDLDVLIPGPHGGKEIVPMQYDLTWPQQHPEQLSVGVTGRPTPIVWRSPYARPLPDCASDDQ